MGRPLERLRPDRRAQPRRNTPGLAHPQRHQDLELGRAATLPRADRLRRHRRLGLPRAVPALPEPGTAARKGAGGKRRCFTGLDRKFDILLISSIGPWLRTMTAKRPATQRKPAGILLRYRDQDTAYGVTCKTTAPIARSLELSETQVVHVALANLARQTLPRYEPYDRPLTPDQLAAIDKLVPQHRFVSSKKRLF